MMPKFNNQYRIESNRMPGWDYSRNGYYFITPVIQNMKWILGKIQDNKMILSDFGKIVYEEWYKSFKIRNELILDEFIIMPNHLHAIIIIKHPDHLKDQMIESGNIIIENPEYLDIDDFDEDEYFDGNLNENRNENLNENGNGTEKSRGDGNVQTHGRASLSCPPPPLFRPPHSISSFMAGFKSATTSRIDDFIDLHQLPIPKYNRNNRLWQLNYNDHIIRNDLEYLRIKNYIINNPKKWTKDKFKS